MKTFLLFPASMLVLSASLAHAQTGMNLAWNNCITQTGASDNKAYVCDGSGNGVPFKLVLSFFTPSNLPQFVGIEATIEVHTTAETLSDWWRLGIGECREANLAFPTSLSGIGTGTTGACQNPWVGANTGGSFQWSTGSDTTEIPSGQGQVVLAFARDSERSLTTNQQYVAGVVTLDTYGDIETESPECSGCSESVCIVLTSIQLFQTVGAENGDIQVITEAETSQYVTWQGAPEGGCEFALPMRITWGNIRATYH